MIRLIVCFDFDTDDLEEAYKSLREVIDECKNPKNYIGWETSDEWYRGFSDDAEDPEELNQAICSILDKAELEQ